MSRFTKAPPGMGRAKLVPRSIIAKAEAKNSPIVIDGDGADDVVQENLVDKKKVAEKPAVTSPAEIEKPPISDRAK